MEVLLTNFKIIIIIIMIIMIKLKLLPHLIEAVSGNLHDFCRQTLFHCRTDCN